MRVEPETLEKPGEYGTQARPQGWTVIQLNPPNGNGRRIYLTSEGYYKAIADKHKIPEANIVHLNHKILAKDAKEYGISSSFTLSNGIPELNLPGDIGLNFFKLKLQPIWNAQADVLIHCAAGQNRTPIAATIYLMHLGIKADIAKELVQAAIRKRDPELRLNQKGHYDKVLQEAEDRFDNKALSEPTISKKQFNIHEKGLQQTSSSSSSKTDAGESNEKTKTIEYSPQPSKKLPITRSVKRKMREISNSDFNIEGLSNSKSSKIITTEPNVQPGKKIPITRNAKRKAQQASNSISSTSILLPRTSSITSTTTGITGESSASSSVLPRTPPRTLATTRGFPTGKTSEENTSTSKVILGNLAPKTPRA